jgi:hypothetical protein
LQYCDAKRRSLIFGTIMARLVSEIQFIGSLGDLTAYQVPGEKSIIVRTKGGVSRRRLKTSGKYKLTRLYCAEFGSRSTASGWIMRAMWPLTALGDNNVAGKLNAMLKPIQELDDLNDLGKRSIQISKNKQLLEGFSLNETNNLDSVLRTSIACSVSREDLRARLTIPPLEPQINFFPRHGTQYYSLIAVLSIVPDLFSTKHGYQPSSPDYSRSPYAIEETPWCPTVARSGGTSLELKIDYIVPDEFFSVMLSLGIRYGAVANHGDIEQVEKAGSAKILALA